MGAAAQMTALRDCDALTDGQWTKVVDLGVKSNRRPIADGKVPGDEYPCTWINMNMFSHPGLETAQEKPSPSPA